MVVFYLFPSGVPQLFCETPKLWKLNFEGPLCKAHGFCDGPPWKEDLRSIVLAVVRAVNTVLVGMEVAEDVGDWPMG